MVNIFPDKNRVISNPQLSTLLHLHLDPINVIISYDPHRILILKLASFLDAFRTYPCPTWLLGDPTSVRAHTPEVSSSRSSRTRDKSSQYSSACSR